MHEVTSQFYFHAVNVHIFVKVATEVEAMVELNVMP